MSLSARAKKLLDIAMGGKKAADALVAKLEANAELDQREKRELEIAMCDKKAAAEIASDELEVAQDDQDAVDAAEQDVQDAQDALDALNPAVAASFSGQVAGMTTDVDLLADVAGAAGNSILLTGDGSTDIDDLIAAWNLANPSNTVSLTSGDGSQIPDLAEEIQLADGADADDDTAALAALAEAQAALAALLAEVADHKVSDRSQKAMDIALADKAAAEELKELIEE